MAVAPAIGEKKEKKLPLGVRMLMICAWRNYKYTHQERERKGAMTACDNGPGGRVGVFAVSQ